MKKNLKLTGMVAALFMTAILMTFIPESFRDFFGDWTCQGGYYTGTYGAGDMKHHGCNYLTNGEHPPTIHWGIRHILWCIMSITLFVIQVVFIVNTFKDKE